jgi:mono/diheme cytochrome c family protein
LSRELRHFPVVCGAAACETTRRYTIDALHTILCRIVLAALCTGAAACSRPAAERAAVDARGLFEQACAKCHASDGTGGLPMVAGGPRPIDLTTADWQRSRTDAEIVAAIRNGRGAMPPFEGVLTTPQIEALASHVRTLQRK